MARWNAREHSVCHLVVYFTAHRHPQWMRSGITSLMINGKWLIKNLANWRSTFMPQSSSKSHEVFVMGTYMAKKWISIGLGITLQFPNSLGEISTWRFSKKEDIFLTSQACMQIMYRSCSRISNRVTGRNRFNIHFIFQLVPMSVMQMSDLLQNAILCQHFFSCYVFTCSNQACTTWLAFNIHSLTSIFHHKWVKNCQKCTLMKNFPFPLRKEASSRCKIMMDRNCYDMTC